MLNEATPDYVMYRKLVRVTEEFMRSHFLKSYGYRKKKLDFENRHIPTTEGNKKEADQEYDEEEEYYYDEEDEEEEKALDSNPKTPNQPALIQSKQGGNPSTVTKDRVMPLNTGTNEYGNIINQKQRSAIVKLRSSESAMAKPVAEGGLSRVASQREMDV